jgi:hypothetical protein
VNEIERMISRRKGDEVTVPRGHYTGDVVVPPGVSLVFEEGTTLSGRVTLCARSSFSGGGSYPSSWPWASPPVQPEQPSNQQDQLRQ